MSIDRLKREENVVVRWIHFPLHPETPEHGISLTDMFKDRDPEIMRAAGEQMRQRMAAAGLPYGRRSMSYNSRLAQELGAWADSLENDGPVHDLLFKAYFVDSHNIGDIDVLVDIASQAGLPKDEARNILETRLFSFQVNENWQRAWSGGVTGVPTFWAKQLYVVGCQPYETLLKFVNHLRTLEIENSR